MIQTGLFFLLGFLSAGFLALMIAPAIWNRAVRLTRRRIEASVPLTMADIQADKDRLRAEFAISTRRLEVSVREHREKWAAQLLELNRSRDEAKAAAADRDAAAGRLDELEAAHRRLVADFEERERQLSVVADRLAETGEALDARTEELNRLETLFEDASLSSSSRQIELVAREGDVDRLKDGLRKHRTERKEAQSKLREAVQENRSLKEELRIEKRRLDDLEQRTESLVGALSDRDERLDRRERDLSRLRERMKNGNGATGTHEDEAVDAGRAELEAEIARLRSELSQRAAPAIAADPARLRSLRHENEALRHRIGQMSAGTPEDAILRDQIADLAAEVVHLTALLDDGGSALRRIVDTDAAAASGGLAGRIRALQHAARDEPEPPLA